MYRKLVLLAALLVLGSIFTSACSGEIPISGDPRPTEDTSSAATQGAMQTEIAGLYTQVAQVTAAGGETAVPELPTPTITDTVEPPPTFTPEPTATETAVPPTATATRPPLPCNAAIFMGDISIPDGSVLPPGTGFTKTWRLENAGACTWTTAYALVFMDGSRLGGPNVLSLPGNVVPGEVIDLSVNLVSPNEEGSYRGNWMLANASGELFGIGSKSSPFFVDIRVAESVSSGPLDFVAAYCQAEWRSGAGRLPCQGRNNDSRGYVRRIDNPTLESGYIDDEPALLTHPQMITDGYISGKYPAIRVEANYFFSAVIGCAYQAGACDVTFRLEYQLENGRVYTLATWDEVYDEEFHLAEVDLSGLAGQNVRFILTVEANGTSSHNRAQWLAPHISER